MKEEGHLTEYLTEFQERYQKLLNSGRDIYVLKGGDFYFALPNKERKLTDGYFEPTLEDINILKKLFHKDVSIKEFEIRPLNSRMDLVGSSILEVILKRGIYGKDYHQH